MPRIPIRFSSEIVLAEKPSWEKSKLDSNRGGLGSLTRKRAGGIAEHALARHDGFVEFGKRLDAEVGEWCAAQAVDEAALAAALGAAARDAREGRETMATLLLTLLAAADDFDAFAGYMAGEAERQGYEPQAPPHK